MRNLLNRAGAIELEKIMREAASRLSHGMLAGVKFKIDPRWGIEIDTTYYDQAHPSDGSQESFLAQFATLAEKLAYEIKDYDFPTSKEEGLAFCQFMGFDEKDTQRILASCASDQSYKAWADEESEKERFYR